MAIDQLPRQLSSTGDQPSMQSLPQAGKYGVILADPPWKFANWSKKGEWKNAARHYDCMTIDELKALRTTIDLDFICAPDCALVMWATFPMLREAIALMAAWGFEYKSGGSWGKLAKNGNLAFGAGYIYRSASELWLLGTRGKPERRSRSIRNLIMAERREHSRKPEQMHSDLESLFNGPYLEMFARQSRPGWDCWGNETNKFTKAA